MTTFLELVARDLYKKLGGDFTNTTIIFPNKRATLFFNTHLANISDGPVWTPYYTSISDIFADLSDRIQCDPIKLVCRLYDVYKREKGDAESLDRFYSWGEMMLSDFEDIDNNMADAEKLFANISDLEDMTDFSFLTEEQKAAIDEFFVNSNIEERTKLKEKFLGIWKVLYPTYKTFKEELSKENLCYEGMMKREVAELMKSDPDAVLQKLNTENYAVVGFNVLNKTEQQLFSFLKKNKNTFFYWDYDETYLQYEAGQFIRQDIELFGNAFAGCKDYYHNFKQPKNITFISSPTENAQTRYVSQWMEGIRGEVKDGKEQPVKMNENAIVLCNESVLPSVLHSIPAKIDKDKDVLLNVTMGFPLAGTLVYSFVQSLFALQIHGKVNSSSWRYSQVADVLRHPYTRKLCGGLSMDIIHRLSSSNIMFPNDSNILIVPEEGGTLTDEEEKANTVLSTIFEHHDTSLGLTEYVAGILKLVGATYKGMKDKTLEKESIFHAYTIINRMHALQQEEKDMLNVSADTLFRIVRQIFSSQSIPFHGEPAIGLQVMGILETRNLDFRNVLLLSCNEDMMPRNVHRASLIPYILRVAYDMTTIEKEVSLNAYYFYNLLQRAENITIMYNSSSEGMNQKEMSRFMMQLKIETDKFFAPGQTITEKSIKADSESMKPEAGVVEKTDAVMEKMKTRFTERPLSPTAISCYKRCSLQFYFQYIAEFVQQDEVSEDIDNPMFGNIFHKCMEDIYRTVLNRRVLESDLTRLANDSRKIEKYVDMAFATEFFKQEPGSMPRTRYNGQQLLNRYVLCKYVRNQLLYDAKFCPMTIRGVEAWEDMMYSLTDDEGREIVVKLGGKIDRYEELNSKTDMEGTPIRITDYKTGATTDTKCSTAQLFDTKGHYIFQALYYSFVMKRNKMITQPIIPSLMFVTKDQNSREEYLSLDKENITDFSEIESLFVEGLNESIKEIYDESIPFSQCEDANVCTNCIFTNFCKR